MTKCPGRLWAPIAAVLVVISALAATNVVLGREISRLAVSEVNVLPQADDHTLKDDLEELLKLIPGTKLLLWFLTALSHDIDAQNFVEYLESSDHFRAVDNHLWQSQDIYDLLDYLEQNDIAAVQGMNNVRALFNLKPIPERPATTPKPTTPTPKPTTPTSSTAPTDLPTSERSPSSISEAEGDDVNEVFPQPSLLTLLKDKLQHLRQRPRLMEAPVVDWQLGHLIDQLKAIMDPYVLPIGSWLFKKLAFDAHIKELWRRLQSDSFRAIWQHMDTNKEYLEFLDLLRSANVPVDEFFQKMGQYLGWK